MLNTKPSPIPIAVRVYPQLEEQKENEYPERRWKRPNTLLVLDTETRTDATQRLTFGSYRFIVDGKCVEEGLFYADDLPKKQRAVLKEYAAAHGTEALKVLTRRQFVDKLFRAAYKGRCLVVGFNLPFDLSRIAYDFKTARGRFAGGFTLGIWGWQKQVHRYRPWIGIKHIDSKRALIGFTGRKTPDEEDRIPEGSTTGKPEDKYKFRGHFLDLRMLAFALTDRGYSLKSACEDFGVDHPKEPVQQHGIVTPDYIDYNRRDVLATWELATKLLEEYDKHPIALQATKAYSPASIGKSYLRGMGIPPVLERQPNFPREYLGYAQSAFFGGRTSAHIRKIAVPVVYTDFLSMYPTVNSLMDLWRFVIARKIEVIEHCQNEIEEFLRDLKSDDLFNPETWKRLPAFVKIIPNGDILPSRGRYSAESNDWQVAVNHLYAKNENDALWFSLPDAVASVILTGRVPTIIDAFRLVPRDKLTDLQPTKLRGAIRVDPAKKDFFRVVIEERKELPVRTDIGDAEKERLDKALKVLANATSYGIYAEMIRQESDAKVKLTCYGIDPESYPCAVAHPESPGEYCFPPMASLITGAARLMLTLLEKSVSDLGGTYAMEDTDSMAILATERGGAVQCGEQRLRALSWQQVDDIAKKFAKLNPYRGKAGQRSILKIEDDNRDIRIGKQRQLYCLAISAKRYALFLLDSNGDPVLLRSSCQFCGCKNKPPATQCKKCQKPIELNNGDDRWSEHGLGHLLNPTDPDSEDREWIAQVWLAIVRKALSLPVYPAAFEQAPAISRITVSSPAVVHPLTNYNAGKQYPDRIKPFNFLLTCHVKQLGHPLGVHDPEHFHLIAPWETDSRKWLQQEWIDEYSGKTYGITTTGPHGTRKLARVKTYGDALREYEFHAEPKCADASGRVCGKQTVGLLQRRHVVIDLIKYIGKESNSLEDVESGLIHSAQNVYTEYPDLRRDEWQTKILPALRKARLSTLVTACKGKLSRRALIDIRAGRSRPHRQNQQMLYKVVQKLGIL